MTILRNFQNLSLSIAKDVSEASDEIFNIWKSIFRLTYFVMIASFLAYSTLFCLLTVSTAFLSLTTASGSRLRLNSLKYDPSAFIKVTVQKPLGISLEENEPNEARGVFVDEISEGNIKSTGKVKRGYNLIEVNGIDVKFLDFDAVLSTLTSVPDTAPLDLVFIDPSNIYKGKVELTVKTVDGSTIVVEALKGLNLRSILLQNNFEVYDNKGKFSNCGGGASCGTCVVRISKNDFWEKRPAFETQRLKKFDENARLSCNTIIEGDCLVELQPQKNKE